MRTYRLAKSVASNAARSTPRLELFIKFVLHCHHESARRGAKTGTQGKKGSYERSKIPLELCNHLLKCSLETKIQYCL